METFVSELPLAIFTLCVLLGAGAFVVQGAAVLVGDSYGKGDVAQSVSDQMAGNKTSLICLLVVVVGFVAAFFHLANPLHAVFTLTGLGSSPLSSEILMGGIFVIAAAVYCLLGAKGKMSLAARKVYGAVLAILGLLFVAFTGAAYMMNTIITWDTPLSVIESVGIALLAGAVVYESLEVLQGVTASSRARRMMVFAIMSVGAVVGFSALGVHVFQAGLLHSGLTNGVVVVQGVMPPLVVFFIAGLIAWGLGWYLLFHRASRGHAVAALVCIVIAAFAARMVFYGLQLSVGL